ncbi:hypothetical protein [Psychrosphaera aestuarii]|uniref:hypothetical protein n=1 Tax=Psychrosphaera aestuarii TaxID=1266052 RepID=UPI001B344AB3|nr:hypothetical protein [Psychrosphaera aestuarii]
MGRYAAKGDGVLISKSRIISVLSFITLNYFIIKTANQVRLAEEFMRLSANCLENAESACTKLEQENSYLLGFWDGNLTFYLTVSFIALTVLGASFIYTESKKHRKAA